MLSFHPKYTVMIYRQRNDFDEWLFIFSLLVSVTFPLALLTDDVHSLSRPHLPHSGSSTQLACPRCARSGLLTPQITDRQKLHSEARATQFLSVCVYLPD